MMKKQRATSDKVRLGAIVFVALVFVFLFWRRTTLMTRIAGLRSTSTSTVNGQRATLSDDEQVNHFELNVAAERYYTIADYFNKSEGLYHGVRWHLISNSSPRALLLNNMLSPDDCRELLNYANASMARSEVVHRPGESGVSTVRTSYGMFVMENVAADQHLRQNVAALVGVPLVHLEATQILRYHPGQYYRLHPDYFYPNAVEHLARGGQRFATVLTWLNAIPTGGGETRFLRALPQPITVKQTGVGNSVLFYSTDYEGRTDMGSQHEAVPPNNGSMKWVAVIWIRQHEFH